MRAYRRRVERGKKLIEANKKRASGGFNRMMQNRAFSSAVDFCSRLFKDNIFGMAAETSFFLLISIFPFTLVILSALARLEMDLNSELVELLLPSSVLSLISSIFTERPPATNMTFISLMFALFSASTAIWALLAGISRAFTGEALTHPVWHRVVAFIFMIGFLIAVVVSLGLWFYGNYLLRLFGDFFGANRVAAINFARQTVIVLWLFAFIFALYRYAPGLHGLRARQMLPGAALAAVGWNVASWGFEIYMRMFSNYAMLYGQVGAVLGLAIWLYVISVVLILGAELNALLAEKYSGKTRKIGRQKNR